MYTYYDYAFSDICIPTSLPIIHCSIPYNITSFPTFTKTISLNLQRLLVFRFNGDFTTDRSTLASSPSLQIPLFIDFRVLILLNFLPHGCSLVIFMDFIKYFFVFHLSFMHWYFTGLCFGIFNFLIHVLSPRKSHFHLCLQLSFICICCSFHSLFPSFALQLYIQLTIRHFYLDIL